MELVCKLIAVLVISSMITGYFTRDLKYYVKSVVENRGTDDDL